MLKLKLDIEIDEDTLRDIFEGQEIKFSKKKIKELQKDIGENEQAFIDEIYDSVEDAVSNWIVSMFE